MPRFTDLISKWTITPLLKASPELQEMVRRQADETARKQITEAQALLKLQGQPMGYALPASQLQGVKTGQSNSKPGTGVSFGLLRELSTFYWCARACINKRQEQIHNLAWSITSEDEDEKPSPEDLQTIQAFFRQIAGPNKSFRQFVDMVVDDLLTLDGSAIYKARAGQQLKFLWPIDAATVRIRVDQAGMLPQPPDNAYEQWIRGKLVAEMTTDELDYLMMNARTNTPYGLSPLESLVLIVNAALKSEVSNLAMLSEGNVPEGLISVPPDWSTDQIKQFQEYWDGILAGDLSQQRRVKFIPGGQGTQYIATKKPADMEFGEMEKWLAVKTCAMFGVSPQSIGMTFDINKATASEQATLAKNESIRPLANLLQDFFNHIIQDELGFPGLKFSFLNIDVRDEQADSEVNKNYISSAVLSINEVRQSIGKDPIEGGDEYIFMTAAGPVPLSSVLTPQEQPVETPEAPPKTPEKPQPPEEPAAKAETPQKSPTDDLKRWRKAALHDLAENRPFRAFQSEDIDHATSQAIAAELKECSSTKDVRAVFRKFIHREDDKVLDAAGALLAELETILRSDGPKPRVTFAG